MVWAGICASGKTPLVFVDPGVKINKNYYLQEILQGVLEPWARAHFGNSDWIFQQDSAPAHKAREVQGWCQAHLPGFISAQEWPPYSPDLNPMDYSVWAILEARACAKPHKNLETLRQSASKLRVDILNLPNFYYTSFIFALFDCILIHIYLSVIKF